MKIKINVLVDDIEAGDYNCDEMRQIVNAVFNTISENDEKSTFEILTACGRFISSDCAKKIKLKIEELRVELIEAEALLNE